MIPAQCDYHRATSIREAVDLLTRHDGAKLLAGGHSLIPMMKLRLAQPQTLVDIGRIAELSGVCREDDHLHVGALTTHTEIAASAQIAANCRLLAEAAAEIGDPQVRNKGTLGGNIAHADPASDLPAVLVALGATVHIVGPDGDREVAAGDFFVDLLQTDLAPTELISAVKIPLRAAASGSAYLKVEHPASGYAVCGAAASVTMENGEATAAELAFNGVATTPVRASEVCSALLGTAADDPTIDLAVEEHLAIAEPLGDIHASGPYRLALAKAYGKRALKRARDRALS